MKIRQLHINRFGHFSECDLVIPGDGLQVIYGPNEAGKTTLLEFLRGLLFDFPARTPYDFGGQGEMAGVATIELHDGRSVELRRRKGNKGKVAIKVDGLPTDLDDSDWLRLLDHADRGLFESVFAFGLEQLRQGEASLKHTSLQSALFGGSLGGLSSPDKVMGELSNQADILFKKGGSKPAINALLAEIRKLSKQIKDLSLRPETFHQAEMEISRASEHSCKLSLQVESLRSEYGRIEKLVRAWPKWWELQQKRSECASLICPAGIPFDARQKYTLISKELESVEVDQAASIEEIKTVQKILSEIELDPCALSHRVEIKSCLELRQSFIDAKQQLPERLQQREALLHQIQRELSELRHGWTYDDLRAFSVDVATRSEIEHFCDQQRELTSAQTRLRAKRESEFANLQRAKFELSELGEPQDVNALIAVLADETIYVANRKQLETLRNELLKLERRIVTQRRKLSPPLAAPYSETNALPVPRAETVADFELRFSDLRNQLRTLHASVEEDDAERIELDKSLLLLTTLHVVPSLEDRDAARRRRDAGWRLVRQKHIARKQVDAEIADWLVGDATDLPGGYERAVRAADDIADRIYENANVVAEREGLHRQLSAIALRLEQKRRRIRELDQRQADLQSRWLKLWESCGFEPLSPAAMLGWLGDYEALCATVAQRDEMVEEHRQLAERVASFEQRLRDASGLVDEQISALLGATKQAVELSKEQQRRIAELRKEQQRLKQQVQKQDAELQSLADREVAAIAQWQVVLERLNFPTTWDTELAREVIDKLSTTRVRLEGLPAEDARISAMKARIVEFEKRVHALCDALNPRLRNNPCELALKMMDEQFERAESAQRKQNELSQRLIEAQSRRELLAERVKHHAAEQARQFALANVSTEAEFLEVVARAEKRFKLEEAIQQLTRDIELIRGNEGRDDFENALSTSELPLLQGRQHDLGEELAKTEVARKSADGDEALARDALLRLDGSSEVASLAEELSRKWSRLAAEIDRYMPLIYAKHLLSTAVLRFERENQPKMIATVARLLSQMTGGKYVEFDRSGGGKQNILVRQFDGVEKTPDQLSAGTREQLYLAIRLAYVLHYCEQNEPLPIVIDDVLVNFDDERTRQTLAVLADISKNVQVLFFSCHRHVVDIAQVVIPEVLPIELSAASD